MLFCERFKEIQAKHGPESVAFLSTGQITTEEMAFLGALFKFGMGFVHCDSNTRQCMATSHVGLQAILRLRRAAVHLRGLRGERRARFRRLESVHRASDHVAARDAQSDTSPEIIVVDPRKTETAMAATQHYAIRPKSDLVLLYGLANILIASGWIDRAFIDAHTTGFDEFARIRYAHSRPTASAPRPA